MVRGCNTLFFFPFLFANSTPCRTLVRQGALGIFQTPRCFHHEFEHENAIRAQLRRRELEGRAVLVKGGVHHALVRLHGRQELQREPVRPASNQCYLLVFVKRLFVCLFNATSGGGYHPP